jgi:predicted 3-demethylubiquinone-9 3-methyltransferase (glyoxalase superfamily)
LISPDCKNSEAEVFSMSAFEHFPRITPFLWFDANAEEAVDFYLSVFKNSRRLEEVRNVVDGTHTPKGGILTIAFELDGQMFMALNGGPMFKFTEATSFVVRCDTQQEVDEYWARLSLGGCHLQWMVEGQVRAFLADSAGTPARFDHASQSNAGHAEDEKTRHCGTGTSNAVLSNNQSKESVSKPAA